MKKYIVATLMLVLVFASCTENQVAKELFVRVDSLMEEHPDSALSLLDSAYAIREDMPKSQRMRYELLRAKAQNKAYVDFTTDSVMKEVVEYYDDHGTANEKMEAHYLLGCTYRDLHESPMALSCYLDATEKADTLSDDCDYGTLMRIWGQVADEYDRQLMPYKELEALSEYQKYSAKCNDSLNYIISIELKMRPYYILKDTTNVIKCTNVAYKLYMKNGMCSDAIKVRYHLLPIYLETHDSLLSTEIVKDFEQKSGMLDEMHNVDHGYEHIYINEARYYEETNNLDSALLFYGKVVESGYEFDGYKGYLSVFSKLGISDSICKYSKLKEQAFDKKYTLLHTQSMFNANSMFNYSRNQKIAIEKEREANRNMKIIFVVTLCSLLLFVLIYNMYKKKERESYKVKTDYLNMKERYTRTRDELKLVKTDYTEYIKKKEEELEEMKSCMDDKDFIDSGVVQHENVIRIVQSDVMNAFHDALKPGSTQYPTENDWRDLLVLVSKELPQFFIKVTKDNILSKSELRATILTRLGLSTTELSFIMNKPIQRITNLKSLANKKLFNDKGAKSFYENLMNMQDT